MTRAADLAAALCGRNFWPEARMLIERALAEELADDPNRLDLGSVPEGYVFCTMTMFAGVWRVWLRDPKISLAEVGSTLDGTGPTPAAALASAVGRIGK